MALADSGAKLYTAGLALLPRQGLVAVVGNVSDSVYFIDAATLERRGAGGRGGRPRTGECDTGNLSARKRGDPTPSVIHPSRNPPPPPPPPIVAPPPPPPP